MVGRIHIFALCLASASAVVVRSGAFLANDGSERMRPEVVASTLVHVEDDWKAQAAAFSLCNASDDKAHCQESPASFAKSCSTVISAVVQGSGGDREVAKEYMSKVCNQKSLVGWHKLRCQEFASVIVEHAMSADDYSNRQNMKLGKVCTGFWSKFVEEERKRVAEEAKIRDEKEKKDAAERAELAKREAAERADREKKEAAEAAAIKRKVEEETKLEAEQKAKREALEAKVRAAEAAARLAQKKAEAEAVQKAAQEKLEEAAKAEQEHLARQAEHAKAEELLKNVTKTVNTDNSTVNENTKVTAVPTASKPQKNTTADVVAPKAAAPKVETNATRPTTNATGK